MSEQSRPCEICGQPIDPERLEVIPETRLCIEHAQKIRKYGGEYVITGTLERTSKEGSLKRNYGGVIPRKKRNDKALRSLREEHQQEQEGKK